MGELYKFTDDEITLIKERLDLWLRTSAKEGIGGWITTKDFIIGFEIRIVGELEKPKKPLSGTKKNNKKGG